MSVGPDPAERAVEAPDEPPPLLGSWTRLYALVLGSLAVTVGLLYALARWAE